MRLFLVIALVLSTAACALPAREWEKPGIGREVVLNDLTECRRAASVEAWRRQLDYGLPRYGLFAPAHYGRREPFFARQHQELDRFANEGRLASFCMRNKGYELIDSPVEITSPSLPRSP